jgi:hypothetical protein
MVSSHFDAWTRRRFGLATSGAFFALLGFGQAAGAKRRKNKKRKNKRRKNRKCLPLGSGCVTGSLRRCCDSATCGAIGNNGTLQTFCCQSGGLPCSIDTDCCAGLGCAPTTKTCQVFMISDRALKTNFASVDPADVLARVRELPLSTWNYSGDETSLRHLGPMAQDFAALFALGDDRHIHAIDGQGVALSAIQGLAAELERLQAENRELVGRITALEQTQAVR